MSDSATADPLKEDKDSAKPLEENLDPDEGHLDEDPENGEETPEENEETPEDPDEAAPEGESEEDDPLLKAKKHADRKIAELGGEKATSEKMLIAATAKNPELLIEMFDPKSELYNQKLAERISKERPEIYQKADAIYRQKNDPAAPIPAAQQTTDEIIERKVSEILAKREKGVTEQVAIQAFQKALGYSDEQFEVIAPNIRAIASQVRETDESVDMETSFKRAFVALFPGDFEKSIRQKTLVDAAKKQAMISPAGSGSESPLSDKKSLRLSKEDEIAWKASGLPKDRFIKLQEKYAF